MKVKSLTESLEKLIENRYVEKEPSNILEAIDNILGKLNEAEMSPEDARDTELLKSARHKIAGKKTNAKTLTPEEQEVLAKYGLDAWGYKGETKMVTPGKTELFQGNDYYGRPGYGWGRSNSDSFSEPKDSWNGRSVRASRGGNYDKANFADRARKLDARAENQPYKDITAARHTDEVSMRSKYGIDEIRSAKATADYHADALRDLDNAEAEAKAQAQRKYDNTMERIADQEERQKEVKQKAQDRIDAILAKHRKEVVESLQHFLRTLNEANMSDEDRRDSEIIRGITNKLMKRSNAKLTDEEKAVLDKYGITNQDGFLRTAGGQAMPRPDRIIRTIGNDELVSRAHGDTPDKVNLADYARKADGREAKRKEMTVAYWDENRATRHDEKSIDHLYGYSGSTQRQARVKQIADMTSDYDAMASALGDRERADLNIKQLQKDRGDALEQKRSDEKRAESRTVSNKEYHTDRLKKHTAEKDRLIAAKKAQFSKKNESLNEGRAGTDVVILQRYSKIDPDKYKRKYTRSRDWVTIKAKPFNEFTDGEIRRAMLNSIDGSVRMLDEHAFMVVWQQLSDSKEWAMQHQDLYTMDAIKAHCGINESLDEDIVPGYGTGDYYLPSKKEVDTARQKMINSTKYNSGRLDSWCGDKLYFRTENGDEISADRDSSLIRVPDREHAFRAFLKKNYSTYDEWDDHSYEDALDAFGESLNEAAGNVRIVETGLSGDLGKEIIDSIIGQMSDGIWENAPYMEYYWPNVDATDNGDIEVSTDWTSKWNQRENKFRNMSDQEVRKFFANKLKAIVQEYLNDTNQNPYTNFNADNEEVCSYLGGHVVSDITVGQAYEAYNILRK